MKTLIAFLMAGVLALAQSGAGAPTAETPAQNTIALGLQGYSPVSYTTGAPELGQPGFAATHEGVTYFLRNEEELKAFQAKPAEYAPAFGGYCAYGLALGKYIASDPQSFTRSEGRTALFSNPGKHEVRERWTTGDPRELARKAAEFYAKESKEPRAQTQPVALAGYSPVAYFTAKAARPGKPNIATEHAGARYFFATEEERTAFTAAPERYAPAYGGYCAYGIVKGKKFNVDPHSFKVVGERLYVFYKDEGLDTRKLWNEGDEAEQVKAADTNWKRLSSHR